MPELVNVTTWMFFSAKPHHCAISVIWALIRLEQLAFAWLLDRCHKVPHAQTEYECQLLLDAREGHSSS